MGIMDLVNLNYKQVFESVMQSKDAQSMMADFLNHCLLHCEETRSCIIDVLSQNDDFKSLVEESMDKIIKKSKMKSEYFD